MNEVKVRIENKIGLHARPAALLISQAAKFKSSITIKKGEKEVNLKSLMSVLSLGICEGDEVIIKADGEDENKAVKTILSIIEKLEN